MSIRPLQQRAIVVAVGRIQERRQKNANVYVSRIERSQDVTVIFVTRTMEMGVDYHEVVNLWRRSISKSAV